MGRGPWTQGAKTGRTETMIREILNVALEGARLCTDGHRDFGFWEGIGLRAPVDRDGDTIAVEALVNRQHIALAIIRVCGKDRRTIDSWEETMRALGYLRPVHQDYAIVSLVKMGTLDRFWSSPNTVNEAIVRSYREGFQRHQEEAGRRGR